MSRKKRRRYAASVNGATLNAAPNARLAAQPNTPLANAQDHRPDPARNFKAAPPNLGRPVLPQVVTFQGLVSTISRAYLNWDEAIKNSLDDARWMRNDIGVMECVEARQRCTALLDWHLEIDGPQLPYHKALQERMTQILKRTPRFTEYRRNLLHAIWYGKYGIQNQYGWHVGNNRNDIVISDWLPVNGDKLVFRFDDGRNQHPSHQIGFKVGAQYNDGDIVKAGPFKRVIEATQAGLVTFLSPYERQLVAIHHHQIEDAAFESPLDAGMIFGIGIRSRIYWAWFQKQQMLALLVEFMERAALGFEIWYYPSGDEAAMEKTQEAAQNRVGRRNILLFPKPLGDDQMAYGVEHIEPNMAGAESMKSLLEGYWGHQIKRYILGQTLTSEADATGLGSGVADLHYQTLLDIVKYDATNLEETITKDVLKPLMCFNDPNAHKVDLRFVINTQSPDVQEKLDAYAKAWEMGARLKESDVLDAIGASVPTADDVILQNPQATAQGVAGEGEKSASLSKSNADLPVENFKQALHKTDLKQGLRDAGIPLEEDAEKGPGEKFAEQIKRSLKSA